MIRTCAIGLATLAVVSTATADKYWIAYEGNDLPENVGWDRHFSRENGGATRRIVDGALELDSLADHAIFDFYEIDRQIDPDPGELFVATWRVKVLESFGGARWVGDAAVVIAPDGGGTLAFNHFPDRVISTRERWEISITPDEFHTYRIESWDMMNYSLWIDGQYVRDGIWDIPSLNQSFVNFGDGGQFGGLRSLSQWDYVRFGVVPEPTGLSLFLVGAFACATTRRKVQRV